MLSETLQRVNTAAQPWDGSPNISMERFLQHRARRVDLWLLDGDVIVDHYSGGLTAPIRDDLFSNRLTMPLDTPPDATHRLLLRVNAQGYLHVRHIDMVEPGGVYGNRYSLNGRRVFCRGSISASFIARVAVRFITKVFCRLAETSRVLPRLSGHIQKGR
jgi:hypothetical protein